MKIHKFSSWDLVQTAMAFALRRCQVHKKHQKLAGILICTLVLFASCKESQNTNNTELDSVAALSAMNHANSKAIKSSVTSDSNIPSEFSQNEQDSLPSEVQSFIKRAIECNHWGGEDGYDADRRVQIEQAMNDLNCSDIHDNKAALLRAYSSDSLIIHALNASDTAYF